MAAKVQFLNTTSHKKVARESACRQSINQLKPTQSGIVCLQYSGWFWCAVSLQSRDETAQRRFFWRKSCNFSI